MGKNTHIRLACVPDLPVDGDKPKLFQKFFEKGIDFMEK